MNQSAVPVDEQLSYSLRRGYVDNFLSTRLAHVGRGHKLLDLGGTKTNQRGRFRIPSEANAIVMNVVREKGLDVQGDAAKIPFAVNAFDWVLCSEVLEHVTDSSRVLNEAHRVLAPGGTLVATVPFLFRIHADPIDIARYTEYFLIRTLRESGFSQIRIEKQGLFWSLALDMLRELLRKLALEGRRRGLVTIGSKLLSNLRPKAISFDSRSEMQNHDFYGRYVGGYGIVAVKT